MKLSIISRVTVGFGLAVSLMAVVGVFSYLSIMGQIQASDDVERTNETIEKLEEIFSLIKDVESGTRVYVITGEEGYLEPFHLALKELPAKIEHLKHILSSNPGQQKRYDDLIRLIDSKIEWQRHNIVLRNDFGFEAVQEAVATGRGRVIMEDLRKLVSEMKKEEYDMLSLHIKRADSTASKTIYLIVFGSVSSFFIVVAAVLMIRRDVKKRMEIEKDLREAKLSAEEANRAKSDFLANVSHEIRTPMNAIIGMADLLSETPLNEEQKKYVEVFRRAGDNLLSLINDVLDLSKVEAGKLELEQINFDPGKVIKNVVEMLGVRAREKGVSLSFDVNPDVPISVRGDRHRLRQILINLIGNAVKFTEEKGEVVVGIKRKAEGGSDELLFYVRDTGIGIPPDKLETIFEPFSQAHSSTTRLYGGTGLGLVISKRIIEMMDGRIWVESRLGEGSTFYFTARFAAPIQEGPKKEEAPIPITRKSLSILLVDDSEDNRLLIQAYLKKTGHTVDTAENGEMAVNKFKSGRYDLVLMDMRMPVMDGYAATSDIRRWESETGRTPAPIIALTAYASGEDAEKSLKAGCTAHIPKPVKKAELLEAIGRYAKGDEKITVPLDPEIANLVPGYLENRHKDIVRMREALEKGDYEAIEYMGHSMRGSGKAYGFNSISDIGQRLEQAAKAADAEEICRLIEDLSSYIERVEYGQAKDSDR